ncbi:hypothetical protein [Paenibacillus germinis]|uniref:hypothetical protein n=1 Tax=Paenibacillus germinis TaxID=2654979 RepID=UPI001FED1B17|nr:hypothetical protein [Paenibacillus germinis]
MILGGVSIGFLNPHPTWCNHTYLCINHLHYGQDSHPFDYITGQTRVEFQEQKEQKEEKDDQGDDKDKNLKITVDNHSQ